MQPKLVKKTVPAGVKMDPRDLTGVFKEAGFVFDSEGCPAKFTQPFQVVSNADGSTTFLQWQGGATPETHPATVQ